MSYSGWAVVELMGHTREVGRVSEVVQYGVTMMQLDAIVRGEAELKTQYVGGSAIFRMTPCSEEAARADWSVASRGSPLLSADLSADFDDGDEEDDGPDSEPEREPRRGGPERCPHPCTECQGECHHFSDTMSTMAYEESEHDAAKAGVEAWYDCKHCTAWLERL